MDAFAVVFAVCGITGVLALVLSVSRYRPLARRLAQTSLWLTLGAVPLAVAIDIGSMWMHADDAASSAFLLGKSISHAMNYGALMVPCAAIAGMALRRVNSR